MPCTRVRSALLCAQVKVASVAAMMVGPRSLVLIHVPDLRPHRKYLLRALASDSLLDGFGLPLRVST